MQKKHGSFLKYPRLREILHFLCCMGGISPPADFDKPHSVAENPTAFGRGRRQRRPADFSEPHGGAENPTSCPLSADVEIRQRKRTGHIKKRPLQDVFSILLLRSIRQYPQTPDGSRLRRPCRQSLLRLPTCHLFQAGYRPSSRF